VETVDEINYFTDVSPEKKKEVEKKNSQSSLAVKRVHQLASEDSFGELPKICEKSTETPRKFKSKFTTASRINSKNSSATAKGSMTIFAQTRSVARDSSMISLPAKASSSFTSIPSKIHRTPPPRNVKVSESVRKLLDEVKEKREKNNSQKKTPSNVINLRLN
jgi:hypothetical protein